MVILALMVSHAEAVTTTATTATTATTTEYAAYALNAFANSVGLGR